MLLDARKSVKADCGPLIPLVAVLRPDLCYIRHRTREVHRYIHDAEDRRYG